MPRKASQKSYLLRIDKSVLTAVQRWANDEQRSLNSQIALLLCDALQRRGRHISRPRKPDID